MIGLLLRLAFVWLVIYLSQKSPDISGPWKTIILVIAIVWTVLHLLAVLGIFQAPDVPIPRLK